MSTVDKDFILAGRAIVTIVGRANRFTFRIRRADPTVKDPNPSLYFVSAMTGTDNETSYEYLGILDTRTGAVRPSRGSKVPQSDPRFAAAVWAFPQLWIHGRIPGGQILHAGRCGRCGKTLTTPESLTTGYGPECRDKLGIPVTKAEATKERG